MVKVFKNERGFTLIEMLIVMLVVTVLLLVMIPNVTRNSSMVDARGCEAFIAMIEAEMEAFKMDRGKYPTSFEEMIGAGYLEGKLSDDGQLACPGGQTVTLKDGRPTAK